MFDIFNLIFLVLAIVILLKLRSVLGRRTGHERPPYDPYTSREGASDDKVISLPGARKPAGDISVDDRLDVEEPSWERYAPPGSPLAKGLSQIAETGSGFDPASFLDGAKVAYEMIVTAFAKGDRKTLRDLLARQVYDGFAEAIAAREERGETVESTFVGIQSADLVDAGVKGRIARVTVKFRSQLISGTRDRDGEIVEGDPQTVREVTDIWTFERDTTSRDPNWKLAATEAAH